MTPTTTIELLRRAVGARGDEPALVSAVDGTTRSRSWNEYEAEVRAMAYALANAGIGHGDSVAALADNSPEYYIVDLATNALGAKTASIYQTNAPNQVQYVLENSDAKIIFCQDESQLAKVREIRGNVPELQKVVSFGDGEADMTYAEMVEAGRKLEAADPERFDDWCAGVKPDDVACLIYTSGTTGPPKAAMITHDNVVSTVSVLVPLIEFDVPTRCMSYLPLAHVAERITNHWGVCYTAADRSAETWFGGGVPTLLQDLQACRPTTFLGVPRVWEKFEAALKAMVPNLSALPEEKKHEIRAGIGLDKIVRAFSGAAPIAVETLEFFKDLDIEILEGWGMTENCALGTMNPPGAAKIDTVGPPVAGAEIRIAEDGEIIERGRGVFKGYLKNETATREALADGWLHTGDLGEFDEDGYLKIVGRKKDLIITAGGENIAPSNIQTLLMTFPIISQAVVIGDRRPFLSALITLDPQALAFWAQKQGTTGKSPEELTQSEEVRDAVQQHVDACNAQLARVQNVRKFEILPRDFSLEEGEITPTLKVKRGVIEHNYADVIEAIYS